jgi:LSD1 subclass zinc finger protein
MPEIKGAAIRRAVRSFAANRSVDPQAVADLLFQSKILPSDPLLRNIKMATEPFKPFIGQLFRGRFDTRLSSELHKLFTNGLKHITDPLEASCQAERYATPGIQMDEVRASSIQDPSTRKRTMIEECFVLDVEQLEQWGILWPQSPCTGFMLLFKTLTGTPLLCKWQIDRLENFFHLSLTYMAPGSVNRVVASIEIWRSKQSDKTKTQHYWMKCPHEDEGTSAFPHRRLLYLPPGAETFKCNQCYNLDYHRSPSMAGLDLSVPFFFLWPR